MRVLVCRPLPAAERSAARLRALGLAPLVMPILTVRPTAEPAPAVLPDAILLTSEAAVPALAALRDSTAIRAPRHEEGREVRLRPSSQPIAVPIFGVGARTVEALGEAGFPASAPADGTAAGLATHVLGTLAAGATVLRLAGRDRKPEPARSLSAAGLRVVTWEVYEAGAAERLPDEIADALQADTVHAALHYSRRSAALLLALASKAGLRAELARLQHHCLSADVAAGLADVPASRIHVASCPTEDALLARLVGRARAGHDVDAKNAERLRPGRLSGPPPAPSAMTETQRDPLTAGPYRRQPPTIDMAPVAVRPDEGGADAAAPETAIEPMAATGLDPAPAEGEPAADIKLAVHPHGDASGSIPSHPAPESAHAAAPEVLGETPAVESEAAQPSALGSIVSGGAAAAHGPVAPTTPERARSGVGALVASGLIGGILGAALAVGADTVLRPVPGDLDTRLAALENRRPAPAPDLGPVDRRVAALEAQLKDVGTRLATAQAALADVAGKPAAPAAAPADPTLRQDLSATASRLDALEAASQSAPTPEMLAEIRTRLDALGTSGEERLRAGAAAVAALQATTSALDGRVKTQGDELARLPPALMAAGLRTVVAEAIVDDLRTGAALRPAIAALERLGIASPDLAALRPYADTPAPGTAALAADFRPIAAKLTAEPPGPTASLGDRLLRMADRIVSVKAVGDGSGTDLPGLVGRIEASLTRGDLPGAAAASDRLPAPAKAEAAEWISRLKGRVGADAAASRIKADALAALDKPSR